MPQRRDANVGYTPYSTENDSGNLGSGLSVKSTPNDFGAQVSEAAKKAGDTSFDLAIKQQGMVNETLMTNADSQLAKKVGQIKGNYMSLTGLAAHDAFPQYQQSLEQARQEARANLPPAAHKGFDTLSMRTIANHIADGSSFAASQLKEGRRDAYSNLSNVSLQSLLDPQIAASKEQSDFHLDTLKYSAQAQIDEDHPGLKTNPETGAVSFDDSTEWGQQLKADYNRKMDDLLSQGYVNRYDTLAKQDVFGAYAEYQQDRDKMPRPAQVALDASFSSRLFGAHTQTVTGNTLDEAQRAHYDILTNPSNPVSVIMKNELPSDGIIRVHSDGDGQAIGGINSEAFPNQFAAAKQVLETKGQGAAKEFVKDFYQKQIVEKNNINDLPEDVRDVVADGIANHWSGFQKELLTAARAGVPRDELIMMRREEYQRLATQNPDKYAKNLESWNNRLDNLQQSTEGKKTYATNDNGGPLTLADYYRIHSEDVLTKGDAYAESVMPGDLALKRSVRQSLSNQMSKVISNESAQHSLDNRNIMRAINGELSNGNAPATEDELRALPGMADLLDNVSARDPKFAETIPTMIAKVARRNDVNNSHNAYENIQRALETHGPDHPNAIASVDHLNRILGRSDGTGINMKDYNDIKPVIEVDSNFKDALAKHMQELTVANGNLDGKGQERAVQWYNQVMAAKKQNDALGDKKLSDADFIAKIGQKDGPPPPTPPSRIHQIENWAKEVTGMGKIKVVNPDGVTGYIPSDKVDGALKAGYKKVQ